MSKLANLDLSDAAYHLRHKYTELAAELETLQQDLDDSGADGINGHMIEGCLIASRTIGVNLTAIAQRLGGSPDVTAIFQVELAVLAILQAKGYQVTFEHPGFLDLKHKGQNWAIGTANEEWTMDKCKADGDYAGPSINSDIPSSERNANTADRIVKWIESNLL
jgi:hypothetical protein